MWSSLPTNASYSETDPRLSMLNAEQQQGSIGITWNH